MENKYFNSIYKQYHPMVLRFLCKKTSQPELSEEIANDTFLKLKRHLDKYDESKSSMSTWILMIANRLLIDYYKKKKQELHSIDAQEDFVIDSWMYDLVNSNSNTTDPHTLLENKEGYQNIQNAINNLPSKYKLIANLYFNNQLKYNEIAQKLDMNLNTVKIQIHQARILLKESKKLVKN